MNRIKKCMKSILLLFLIAFQANIARSNSELNSALTISHYDIDVEIFPSEHKFVSQVEMRIVDGDRTQNANRINFSLNAVKIHWVKDEHGNGIVHRFVKKQNKTGQLRLFPDAAKFDTMIVNIKYEGVSLGSVSSHVEEKNSYLLFESDWYPQLTNFEENAFLFTYDLKVTVPKNQVAVSSGELDKIIDRDETRCYYWKMSHPTFAISIGSAEYEKQEYKFDELSITTYLYPEHKNHSDSLVTMFRNALEFFADEFGNFPFLDYKIVETNRRGGYSSAGMIILSQDNIASFIKTNNYMSKFTLIHEIAHQWWAHKIIHDPWTDGFLNEALAQYASYRFVESSRFHKTTSRYKFINIPKIGIQSGKDFTLHESQFATNQQPIEYNNIVDSPVGTENYRWAAYYKGFYFLRALESYVSETIFKQALREYLERYKFQVVTHKELQDMFESASGKNLDEFFHSWIYTTSRCDYAIDDLNCTNIEISKFKTKAIVKNNGLIMLPLEVCFKLKTGTEIIYKIEQPIKNKYKIEVETDAPVIAAVVDPNWRMLDANRMNNVYPRTRHFYFLGFLPEVNEMQYYYGPAVTFGKTDGARIGVWLTNIQTLPETKTTQQTFEWRIGTYYGVESKRPGLSMLINSHYGMPSLRWSYGICLNNTRGRQFAQSHLSYNWDKQHQIKAVMEHSNLSNISYFDPEDFEEGKDNKITLNYQQKLGRYKISTFAGVGLNFLGGQYEYQKISLTAEAGCSFFSPINLRLFMGAIHGIYPLQESFFLSGSVKPTSWIYNFFDPDFKTSTQERLHTRGDANLAGYFGQHTRGEKAVSLNAELQILKNRPNLKLFADVGNVWNNHLEKLYFDAGVKLYLNSFFEIIFPFYLSSPMGGEKKLDFRWVISFGN